MKFKKIEISAFRIYDNPENAIFDFTSSTGEPAGLISLYAPNGFGKTSFYDAVEWGVTGSVNRFFIRKNELEKLEQNQILENNIPLLRNSNLERDTYVKITSDSNQILSQNLPKISKKSDLKLKDDVKSHEFHKVILSQEWISAFLTETNGENRYKKFMEIPELTDINSYFLNLKYLLSQQDNIEKDLKNEIEKLEKQNKNVEEQNLLEIINKRTKNVNGLCDEKIFNSLRIESNDAEILVFKDTLTTKYIHYKNKIQFVTEKLDDLQTVLTGKDDLISLKSFENIKTSLPKVVSDIEEIKKVLEKFDNKEKIYNELKNLKESFSEISTEKEKLGIILKKYSEFQKIKSNIKLKEEELNKLKINLPEMKSEIDRLRSDEITKVEEFKSCLQQIKENEERKEKFPELLENLDNNKKSINEISKEIENQTSKIETLERKINENTARVSELERLQSQLKDGKYLKESFEEEFEFTELIDKLNKDFTMRSKEKEKLSLIDKNIEKQQDLNSTIQKFIEQGLSIVNEQQTSKCPLCESQYSDMTILAERISSNNALSDVLKEYNSKKQRLLESIKNIEEIVKSGNEKLINYYTNKINDLNNKILLNEEEVGIRQRFVNFSANRFISLFGVPSGKCGFTTLRNFPDFLI